MDMKSVIMGEAPESDEEEQRPLAEVVGKINQFPVQGIVVAGEASESENDSEDSCSTASEAFYSKSGAVQNHIEDDYISVKYDSLLHKKLRESNVSLYKSICEHNQQCFSNTTRLLNKINQQLLISQVEVQDAASASRKALSNLQKVDASLSTALAIPYLPNINIMPLL
uniref:Biogenesis of lysosome-related organelles complex 1 subunit 3 n=1 Tax=Clastoptera arizonana TaxID=38151 RepID=A0A1B6D9A1_9HEMI